MGDVEDIISLTQEEILVQVAFVRSSVAASSVSAEVAIQRNPEGSFGSFLKVNISKMNLVPNRSLAQVEAIEVVP